MDKLITLLIMLLNIPIYLIARIVPKNKNLSVIGSSLGNHFADNSKYFFIYFHTIKKETQQQLVWITKNKKIVKLLHSQKLPVEYLYSIRGLYTTIVASKAFLSHQLNDINGPLLGGATIIQLWHGIPLKKIGYNGDWNDSGLSGKIKLFLYKIMPFNYYMTSHKLIAPCTLARESYKEAFKLSFTNNENIIILGQPRNDSLTEKYKFNIHLFPEINTLKKLNNKFTHIVSWLPTQRKALKKNILDVMKDSNLDIENLNKFCKKKNILFVIKPHFLDINLVQNKVNKYSNIIVYNYADPYPLLSITDILLTDYSSVYFDFLLTHRPIIFTPFDYEEYALKVNFYNPYEQMTPGAKCYSWESVMLEISNIINNNDKHIDGRKSFLDNLSLPTKNSEIIYNYFYKEFHYD